MRTRDDGDVLSAAVPGLKPWWRSVGFWLGAWVLAYLVWVGVDSYTSAWRAWVPVTMQIDSYGHTIAGKEVLLQGGRVVVGRTRISAPADVTVRTRNPRAQHLKGGFGLPETAWWGSRRKEMEAGGATFSRMPGGNPFAGVTLEVRQWWCPYGVVLLGYVGVWVCVMRWWRRRMRRRWEASRMVEGVC